jgi:hypothetical protein
VGMSVSILSSMITPTILILASASLIGATTARLERTMVAMHELAASFDSHLEHEQDRRALNEEQISLMVQVERAAMRVRLMQVAMGVLHVAITMFVLAELGLGLEAATALQLGWFPVALALFGAMLLLTSVSMLVYDGVIAIQATREEASFTLRMTEYRAAELRHTPKRTTAPVSWS